LEILQKQERFSIFEHKRPLYIKERNEIFKENGNGWWITPPATDLPKNRLGRKKLAKQIEKRKSNVR